MTKRTRARAYEWRTETAKSHGVMLTGWRGRELFIPAQDLYRVADLLVDHAERLDSKETP